MRRKYKIFPECEYTWLYIIIYNAEIILCFHRTQTRDYNILSKTLSFYLIELQTAVPGNYWEI